MATFEGLRTATDHAQAESKKQNKELLVILSKRSKLSYRVVDVGYELKPGEKIMGKYKNGKVSE